jgi:hypothetical protein
MKKAVLLIFFILVCGTSPLYAETVIMDNYGLDYHIRDYITVYEGYSIYGLKIVDSVNGDVSYGLLAINPSPLSYFPFVIIGLEDSKYWSFTIQGYWQGDGTVAYLSTNNVSTLGEVTLSLGEQRH